MEKKILFLFIIILSFTLIIISQAKYVNISDITIAKINIDTIIPEVKIMNTQNVMYKENENFNFDVIINLKVIENNIKDNKINNIKFLVDNIEMNDLDFKIAESKSGIIEYEVRLKRLNKNQKIKISIPEGIIIDNANNKNKETILEHEIN